MNLSVQFKGGVHQEVTSFRCAPGTSASGIRSADLVLERYWLRLGLLQLLIFPLHQVHILEEQEG